MIEIRSSNNSDEIDLSGLPKDLRGIQQSILDLLQNEHQKICIIQAKVIDPLPYDICLSSLLISKTHASVKVSVSGNFLKIEGDTDKLETLASWFQFDDDTWSGYHSHFDHFGCEEWVDSTSSPLIISVRNSVKRV